jgi:SAM-dependent methyltransferase
VSDDLYRQHADTYAAASVTSPANAAYDRPAVLRLCGDLAGRRVLELGSAAGLLTEALADAGADVLGVDREPRLVELAQERLGNRARVEVHDLHDPLDLVPDASVDVVAASLVLHYLPDWAPLLAEVRRCLVPGGALVLSIHHPITGWRLSDGADYHRTELVEERWDWDGTPVTARMWRRPVSAVFGSLRAAGFAIDVVDEPLPDPSADVDPRIRTILETTPVFLFVRAVRAD